MTAKRHAFRFSFFKTSLSLTSSIVYTLSVFFFPWPQPIDVKEGVVVFQNMDTGKAVWILPMNKSIAQYEYGQPLSYSMKFDRPSTDQSVIYNVYVC
jgi:hypothetical protein